MCGAYGFNHYGDPDYVGKRYQLSNVPVIRDQLRESYNIRPSQQALIITRNSPNKGEFRKFGFPAPCNDKQLLINAKSETVAELRTYKKLFAESGEQAADVRLFTFAHSNRTRPCSNAGADL